MRRVSVFLSMLIMAALLLAACGGQETSTSVPSTNVPPITAESTATEEGVDGTETAGPSDTTTTPGIPVTSEDSPSRLTNLLDYDVWNQNGEQIGEVEDMVLDLDNTMISYVIVGTGGFLELGEKNVAVPWDMLQLQGGDAASGQENAFVFTGDQELYNNAPDTDVSSMMPEMGAPADDWDADIRGFWEGGVVAETPATSETQTPAAEATASPEATAEATADATQGTDQGQVQQLQGVMLASDVLGATIQVSSSDDAMAPAEGSSTAAPDATASTDATAMPQATATTGTDQGNTTGEADVTEVTVEDMIIDPTTGEIQFLVVSGGFADGERWIPVPVSFLQWNATDQNFALGANAATLGNAPVFEGGQFPDFSTDDWSAEFDSFWANPDASGG